MIARSSRGEQEVVGRGGRWRSSLHDHARTTTVRERRTASIAREKNLKIGIAELEWIGTGYALVFAAR